jgi:NAD(P)H-nitrite reductase large subunit
MRWAGHEASMEKRETGAYRILVGNLSERDQLKDPGTDRKIISKLILRKSIAAWTDVAQDMDMMDLCECNNVPLGTIKCRKFLVYLNNY